MVLPITPAVCLEACSSLQPGAPLVTVAIPLFNHSAFIPECLDSVFSQDHPRIELLLVDDGSSDDGFERARCWVEQHGQRFERTQFESQTNAGITRTMDRLIRMSQGDFIAIVASDDVLLPGSISMRVAQFTEPSILAVFGDAVPVDPDGEMVGRSAIAELGLRGAPEALVDRRTLLWELVFRWNVYGSVLISRRNGLVGEDGGSILDLSLYSEDMQFYYRFAGLGALKYLNVPVSKYRLHDSSTCRSEPNVEKIRRNIYESRKNSLRFMPVLLRFVIRLQMLTYFRTQSSFAGLLLRPFALVSYLLLWVARNAYDGVRLNLLGQPGPSR